MRRLSVTLSCLTLLLALLVGKSLAQTGPLPPTPPHGVVLNWFLPNAPSGPTVTGFNVYRCFGTCAQNATNWTLLTSSPLAPTATTYIDSSSATNAPNLSTQYSYVVAAVASTGTLGYTNVIQITTPASWPAGFTWTNANLSAGVQ
jgi:hypothetical protein